MSSSGSITPLSALGRQPQTPEFCLPTCSKNLSNETGNWQNTLTGQLKPEGSAKDSTIN
ncbi:lipoprotein precursor [Klebsiella pneumoniae subsp. pneumoniae KPNIH17]|nr:lipoprotein precursor [Klebsiella pneumoniae subsp. pneumoniae KPNIH17]